MAKAQIDGAFADYKKDALTLPRDLTWDNWAKFEKVGDMVQGYIADVFYRKAEGEFKAQRGITLKQPDGDLINVGIKRIPFVLAKTDGLRIGDPLTIEFDKELAPRQKGYKPTKQFAFYGKNISTEGKTVRELELEDMKRQEISDESEEDAVPEETQQ